MKFFFPRDINIFCSGDNMVLTWLFNVGKVEGTGRDGGQAVSTDGKNQIIHFYYKFRIKCGKKLYNFPKRLERWVKKLNEITFRNISLTIINFYVFLMV